MILQSKKQNYAKKKNMEYQVIQKQINSKNS